MRISNRTLFLPIVGMTFLALAGAQQPAKPTLSIGDTAPPLKVAKWIKGTPVTTLGAGKVNVVEFWATWCGPCRESIPHLTELAHKYGGQATFTGVSVFEHPKGPSDDIVTDVQGFVKDMGDKMDYHVATDGATTVMGDSWMNAAGQDSIPTAFVIDQRGKIAWIGHPMDGLDEVVGQVIKGTFNPKSEADRKAKAAAEQEQLKADFQPMIEAAGEKKFDVAIAEIDKLMVKHPELADRLGAAKFDFLLQLNEIVAYSYAKELATTRLKDNPAALNEIAWTMIDDASPLKKRDYVTALGIAHKAAVLSKMSDPAILDTYAYAMLKVGEAKGALGLEQKAIDLATKLGAEFPAQSLSDMKHRLAKIKAAVASKG